MMASPPTQNSLHANTHANINTMERPSMHHDLGGGDRPPAAPVSIPSNFLRNLYGFLNNNLLPDTIAWDADGRSFSILDPDKMETSLPMPNLYRGRFKTFKAQLEKHGFMKSPDGTRYFRPDFVKGQPQQLGDSDVSPTTTVASLDDLEADIKPLSLECRIQLPKKRRLDGAGAPVAENDVNTHSFWSSLHDAAASNGTSPTNGLTCSFNISKHNRFGIAHHRPAAPATVSSSSNALSPNSIPSLRHHHNSLAAAHHHHHHARLPSISRAFPLFGLKPPSDGTT
ncbi:Aste57867_16982 [Aphanomyces stellatus]|uniref:Aste57867_16982 protein n=1 Tax=Aphanomyces stellatus TaxID=120398 RepID=A0A485L6Q5_9STRA|nr:hypothetical protein As57867_016924 [Aphanomyces stellatus]VFT93743.1 Aste57867_16982 [Aphanomyces stellatus]